MVWIDCDPRIRAQRVAGRDGVSVERALADNEDRQRVERDPYLALYAVDLADLSIYDLALDSGELRPAALADRIVAVAAERFAADNRLAAAGEVTAAVTAAEFGLGRGDSPFAGPRR